jgi:hypothetical protein
VTDESRPTEKAAPEVIAATDTNSSRELAYIGAVSREIGWESCWAAVQAAGEDVARGAGPTWQHPRQAELERCRTPDHRPCPTKCDRCSRCIHSHAWWRRGCRPYLGVEAERQAAS